MTPAATPDPRIGAGRSRRGDSLFRGSSRAAAFVIVGILLLLAVMLTVSGSEAFGRFGIFDFVTGTTWDPVNEIFGALPYIVGTLLSATIAIVIATPIAILTAVYLSEFAPGRVALPLTFLIELIAAIPSVVIGLWGVFVLTPFLKGTIESFLVSTLGGTIPLFEGPPLGIGLFAAGVILAIMILPTIVSISREVISSVPATQREAMFALGATRWEVVAKAVLPAARSGIAGAIILGLGRALGETMAVTMVIGNAQQIPTSLFDQSQTIASKIATTFNEASIGIQTSSLIALGLILLVMSVGLNVVARLLVGRTGGSSPR
ncbi:MAG: phosphate ABC transporter permease subunit PstC [Candidatus Limnocylindrales bacterium]